MRRMMRNSRSGLVGFCFLALALSAIRVACGDGIPRYQLQVGQQFVFHGDRTCKPTETMVEQLHSDWKVDVIAQNSDGSWRLLGVIDSGGSFSIDGQGSGHVERVAEAAECDLYPDGTMKGLDDPLVNLPRLFPRLPGDQKQWNDGWDDLTADHARNIHFQDAGVPGDANFHAITATPRGGIVGVFEPGSVESYRFDRAPALVSHIDLATEAPDQIHGEKGTIQRTAVNKLEPQVIQALLRDSAAYEAALNHYTTAMVSASTPAAGDALKSTQADLSKAGNALVADTLSDASGNAPDLKNVANAMIPDPPSPADVLDQPAPDWQLKTLDGVTHSLKEFRGKVVLLDFGSRGCTWCMREIPQLVRLAQDFKDQPVQIISMDYDADPADVKFVADNFQIPYLVLINAGTAPAYPVEGTPTVVIVDQNGIMRRRVIGYSMLGYEEFRADIESLLKEKKPAPGASG